MEKINYLECATKIAVLNKSKYKIDFFKKVHEEILKLNKDSEILSVLNDIINVPAVALPPTVPDKPKDSQLRIEYKNPDQTRKPIWFEPPKFDSSDNFEDFKEWITKNNILETDEVVLYAKYKGFAFKLEVFPSSKSLYIKDKYGNVTDITAVMPYTELSDIKFKLGTYYGYVTPITRYWEDQGTLLSVEYEGKKIHQSPLNALYNALFKPQLSESKQVLKATEWYINRIANTFFTSGTVSNHLENATDLDSLTIPFEVLKISDITEELLASYYLDYIDVNYISGVVLELNSYIAQTRLSVKSRASGFAFYNLISDDQIRAVEIKNIDYQLSRFGEIIPVLHFNEELFKNKKINKIILDDATLINQYEIGIGSVIEISISENEYGEIKIDMVGPVSAAPNFTPITICPKCGSPLKNIGDGLFCSNDGNCVALIDKKNASFFNLMGYTRFTTVLASKFRDAGIVTPYEICKTKYTDMLNICNNLKAEEISALFTTCQKLLHQGAELNRLQTASSCFNGINTSELKRLNINTTSDAVKVIATGEAKDEILDMVDSWLSFHEANPFIIKK